MMGPFNTHFVRDVGLAYPANGAVLFWAGVKRHRAVALAGSAWFVLHALFHIQIWAHRSFTFDHIFLFDLLMVIGLAAITVLAALSLPKAET